MDISSDHDVYLIQEIGTHRYKIGTSANIPRRLEQLQTGNSRKLILIGTCAGGREREQFLHDKFQSCRCNGGGKEWYIFDWENQLLIFKEMDISPPENHSCPIL